MNDRENVISGLKYTIELFLFDPATGHSKDPDDLNALDRITYDACVGAIALLKEQEDLGTELTNAVELIHKKNKRIEKLLKEQEAITIKKTKEHGFGVYGGICPKCRNWIQSAHSYCGFCGQAVKWE